MSADRRARFAELHARDGIFVMPNPWDAGSAKLLAGVELGETGTAVCGHVLPPGRRSGHLDDAAG